MIKLFLLKPDFTDEDEQKKYFCPPCALINGFLSYYPQVKENIAVEYVDFVRPRLSIVSLIGEANQSCPVLVLDKGELVTEVKGIKSSQNLFFIDQPEEILNFLASRFNTGYPH